MKTITWIFLALICFTQLAEAQEMSVREIQSTANAHQQSGVIMKFDAEYHEALVNPVLWEMGSLDMRRNLAMLLAMYCHAYANPKTTLDDMIKAGEGWVEIKDGVSGKRLAKYGPEGFQVD